MKTFEDLVATPEHLRGAFCADAIREFQSSTEYREARAGDRYYNKHNETIEKYQKFLYTVSGRKVPDLFSSNYKLKTTFFRRLVTQQVQYVLGNGVSFSNETTKEKLGKDFDFKVQSAAKIAMSQAKAFGFWNVDHVEVFGYADTPTQAGFCPLQSEMNAELMAGIRFWFKNVGGKTIARYTLYEVDGVTEYRKTGSDDPEIIEPKRPYKLQISSTRANGVIGIEGSDYGRLPIVPLYANDTGESELVGIRESVDCYDFVKSNFANDIDDTSGFFWILKNEGGMDDVDLARFIQRMKTVRGAVLNEGEEAIPHTIDVPVEARKTMLEILRRDIYEDFQALDVTALSAAQKTAQEIKAAYQSQDNKCADFEYYILDFIQKILEIAGIDDNPVLNWNKIVNPAEITNMLISSANFLSEECIIKHLPFLTPEEADEEVAKLLEANAAQFGIINGNEDNADE